jgi:hypothetical protein
MTKSSKEELMARMGEVAEHRALRWLDELEGAAEKVTAKERLIKRFGEVDDVLAVKWLEELNQRAGWCEYQEMHEGFCYGVGFGACEDCAPDGDHEPCPNYEFCKEEHEAAWPDKSS